MKRRVGAMCLAGLASLVLAAPALADTWDVTGTGDASTGCVTSTHLCPSLRSAIAASEATKELADTINVPAGVININNDLVIQSDITVVGASARTTIIDGGSKYRGFRVVSGGNAKIEHLMIRNGAAGQGDSNDGGAIVNLGGVAQLETVRLTTSRATSGGAIANVGGTILMYHSLIDGNTATGTGGAIYNQGTTTRAAMGIADTTVFNNTAGLGGTGGIDSRGNDTNLMLLVRVTIADNTGGARSTAGGLLIGTGTGQATGVLVARNVADGGPSNCGATKPANTAANVEDDKTCGFSTESVNPALATSLVSAGGEVNVLPITAASPAVDLIPTANCGAGQFDARGMYRPQGPRCDSGAYELDQAATVTITDGPSGTITTGDVLFGFQANEPDATVQCQLTGPGQSGGFATCYKSNAQPYSGLADGTYTFSVRAVTSSFPNPKPTTQTFTVDTTPPDTTITSPANGSSTNDTTPSIAFSSDEAGSTFQCQVDTATYVSCTSPFTTGVLAVGTHTIRVRATDAAGLQDPTPAAITITIDTTAPQTTINSGPSGTVASPSAAFTYSSSEPTGATFQCALDGSGFAGCPASYTGLAQGTHTFQVRAIDAAGNVDATPASQSWTVDTVAPDTNITGGPSGTVASATATFTYTSTEPAGATFECSFDSAAFAGCPTSYTGLSQGSHTFQVRSRDAVGNVDATPATRTWTVDTVAPDTSITGGPSGSFASTSAAFTYTSNEGSVTFQCQLDAASGFGACPASYTGLSQGSHTFQVRAVDAAGTPDPTPATRTWTVDTVAPDTLINSGPSGSVASPSATFTYSSTETGSTFQCAFDGSAFSACPAGYTGLAQGAHTFQVRAVDAAGNLDGTPASRSFTVDTTAPDTTITSGPSGATNDTTPTWAFTSGETPSTFECRVDGGTFTVCTTPFTATTLTSGNHTFDVRARDAAGNPDASPATRAIFIDTSPPNAPTISTPAQNAQLAVSSVTFSGDADPGDTVELLEGTTVRGSGVAAGGSWTIVLSIADGTHTYTARSTDPAGNVGAASAARTITVDAGPPDTTITSGPASPTNNANPTFTFSSTKAGTYECSLDGDTFAACATPFVTPKLPSGEHTLSVRAVDTAGNKDNTPATRTFVVDLTPPAEPTITSGPSGPITDPSPAFAFAATDAVECKLDGPNGAAGAFGDCASPKSFSNLAAGEYLFTVRSTDAAGNRTTSSRAFTVTVPQQATPTPTPTVTPPPPPPPPIAVLNTSVVVAPKSGTVLIKLPGAKTFVLLPTIKSIPNGSEVDARKGHVTLTSIPKAGAPPETAEFWDGLFIVNQKGGVTTVKLSEKLTGCPKGFQSSLASAAAKKPKTRKLWGSGKGKFRTEGKYSAATVRGTVWLVQDTCTTTFTRVKVGVVAVSDFAKKKTIVIKKGKTYTAKPKAKKK